MSGDLNQPLQGDLNQHMQVLNQDLPTMMDGLSQDQSGQVMGFNPQFLQIVPPQSSLGKPARKQKFSPEEDEKLKILYQNYGPDWKMISACMENRTQRQCRDRWKNYLSPNVSTRPWTAEEDELLIEKYNQFGRQWSLIAKFFDKRTDIHIKNRWVTISSKQAANEMIPHHDIEVPPLTQ